MKNIFKENKKLKEENNMLRIKVNELQKDNTDELLSIQEHYEKTMNKKIEYLKVKYNTQMERKKEVEQIAKLYEDRIAKYLKQFIDIDLSNDIDNYLKLLKYLKEN